MTIPVTSGWRFFSCFRPAEEVLSVKVTQETNKRSLERKEEELLSSSKPVEML